MHIAATATHCWSPSRGPEPFHARLREQGYKSAYLSRHGKEPPYTWPSGIQVQDGQPSAGGSEAGEQQAAGRAVGQR